MELNVFARCALGPRERTLPRPWHRSIEIGVQTMNGIIYLVGLIVIVMAILGALGLR